MWGTLVKSSAKESLRQVGPWVLLGGVTVTSGAVGLLPVRFGDPVTRHASDLIALQRFLGLLFAAISAIPSLAPSRFCFGAARWGPPPWGPHLASQSLFLGQAAALALFFLLCTVAQLGILFFTEGHAPPVSWGAALVSTWIYGWGCLALARALGSWLQMRQALGAFLVLTLLLPMVFGGGGEAAAFFVGLFPGPSWLESAPIGATQGTQDTLLETGAAALFIISCNLLAARGLAHMRLGVRGLDQRNSKA